MSITPNNHNINANKELHKKNWINPTANNVEEIESFANANASQAKRHTGDEEAAFTAHDLNVRANQLGEEYDRRIRALEEEVALSLNEQLSDEILRTLTGPQVAPDFLIVRLSEVLKDRLLPYSYRNCDIVVGMLDYILYNRILYNGLHPYLCASRKAEPELDH